jgi:hypothetical protein
MHSGFTRTLTRLTLSLPLLILVAATASATTFVAMPDPQLAAEAPVIVEGTVLSLDPSRGPGRPATEVAIQVERVLQGTVGDGRLAVRVPGGTVAGQGGLLVWGAPSFRPGERVLLFLAASPEGGYQPLDLMLGAFHQVTWAGRRLAVRDLSQAAELVEPAGGGNPTSSGNPGGPGDLGGPAGHWRLRQAAEQPRDWQGFTSWLAARAKGADQAARATAAYRVDLAPADLAQVAALAAAGRQDGGLRPPAKADLSWFADLGSDPAVTGVASDAIAAFLDRPALHAAAAGPLSYGGATSSLGGLDSFDGRSSVLFRDQGSDGDLPAFRCGSGGLVSLSGSWFDRGRQVQGGTVVLAAGIGCLFAHQAGTADSGLPESGLTAVLDHDLPQALLGSTHGAVLNSAPAGGPARSGGAGSGAPSAAGPVATGPVAAKPLAAAPPAAEPLMAVAAKAAAAQAPASQPSTASQSAMTSAASPAMLGRGYHARGCGFDLNHNGIFGEPADCHVCDGITTNPYSDSAPPNMVYVSCQTGADNPSCGSPGNPCASINYAWNYRTGPPASPSADIICFRGTCHEDGISTAASGKPGAYILPPTGSETMSWQLPLHPTMLVGWDYNHNGLYPPYDTQDEAVLEGSGLAQALKLNGNQINSDVELAHFTVRNYGTGVNVNPTGFMQVSNGAYGTSSRVYIHDLSIQDVNRGKALDSGNIMFDFFGSNAQISYFAVENVEILNAGGYIARGAAPSGGLENGPYRFKNITWTALGCNASGAGACADPPSQAHVVGFKLWGYVSQIEILDSLLNLNTAAWNPYSSGFGSTAFFPAQCSRNWTIRNNEIDDFKTGLIVQGYAGGYCDGAAARSVDGVIFDRNVFRNTYTHWLWNDNGVQILGGGPNPQTSVGSVLVSNNFFSSTPGWQGMAYINAGNNGGPDPANLAFVNNTTVANLYRPGFGAITLQNSTAFPPQTVVVKNNIIGGLGGGQENIHTDYAPAAWDAAANVFDPNGVFVWQGGQLNSLASWQQATHHDWTARQCRPSFVNVGGGDFHLQGSDACAMSLASALSGLFTWDVDGNSRPLVGPWDSGAHEAHIAVGPSPPVRFYTLPPCRVLDTRTSSGPLNSNTRSVFAVAGRCGVPASAISVSFNVAVVNPTADVSLQAFPGDQPAGSSNVVSSNPHAGNRAAAAVLALAVNGSGTLGVLPTFQTAGQVDLLLDVNGYFAP